jgi:MFS family permease
MAVAGLASAIGWSFDLFDLFILLFIASTLSKVLFPHTSPTLALASVYASFAVSLLLRPLGGAIFGRFADRRGRRRTLVLTVGGVGLATALMGAVPSYAAAGAAGPALFVALRLVQGVLVGGVVASSHTIGTETVPQRWRGLVSGLVGGAGASIGAVLASLLLFGVSAAFPGPAFLHWGWRVMFFSALAAAALALLAMFSLEESPLFAEAQAAEAPAAQAQAAEAQAEGTRPRAASRQLLGPGYRGVVLTSLLVVFGAGAQYYLTSGYLPTFLGDINGVPTSVRSVMLVWASLAILPATLMAGHLSERFGRRRTMITIGAVNIVALPLLVWALAQQSRAGTGTIIALSVALSFLANAAYAPVVIFLNERFPTAIRATGTALTWNSGFALGGLMTTFVSLASPSIPEIPSRLVMFIVGCTAVYVLGAWICPETRGALEAAGAPVPAAGRAAAGKAAAGKAESPATSLTEGMP